MLYLVQHILKKAITMTLRKKISLKLLAAVITLSLSGAVYAVTKTECTGTVAHLNRCMGSSAVSSTCEGLYGADSGVHSNKLYQCMGSNIDCQTISGTTTCSCIADKSSPCYAPVGIASTALKEHLEETNSDS
jgi:hypothetical protein